jgi:hypothetical protein
VRRWEEGGLRERGKEKEGVGRVKGNQNLHQGVRTNMKRRI